MSNNLNPDVIITSKPSEGDLTYFEITSPGAPIGSGLGFIKTSETPDEQNLRDYLELNVENGGSNPYKWFVRPNDPNKPDGKWYLHVKIKRGNNQATNTKPYVRSVPILPFEDTLSIIVCFDKLIIESSAIYSTNQKLVLDPSSTAQDLILRIVTDGSGTYPFEHKLIQDGVIHTLGVSVINEIGNIHSEEITYLR